MNQWNTISFAGVGLIPLFDHKQEEFKVDFDVTKFARTKVSNNTVQGFEDKIDEIWDEKAAKNSRLYNGSKFRYHSLKKIEEKLTIQVGITDYKDLLGTHYSPFCKELDEKKPGKDVGCYMSNAIGVGSITVTSDNYVVLVKRASWTGEHAGWIDRPGGHPEPEDVKKVCIANGIQVNIDYTGLQADLVMKEILESPQHELRDEANIPLVNQLHCGLLGVIFDEGHGMRVGFDSHVETTLTKGQVHERYSSGAQAEADESTGLVFIPLESVRTWSSDLESMVISNMTPHCRGGLRLLHLKMNRGGSSQ